MLRYFDLRPIAKRVYGNRNNIHSNLIQEFVVVREFGVRNRLSGEGGDLRICKDRAAVCSESYRDSAAQRPAIRPKFKQSLAVRGSRLKVKQITGVNDGLCANGQGRKPLTYPQTDRWQKRWLGARNEIRFAHACRSTNRRQFAAPPSERSHYRKVRRDC